MAFILILIVDIIITVIIHKVTEKNIGFSSLMFVMCLVLGIILYQPAGDTIQHPASNWSTRPERNIEIPCEHSHEFGKIDWATTTVYTTVWGMLVSSDDSPVLIYCPMCNNENTAREYYKNNIE